VELDRLKEKYLMPGDVRAKDKICLAKEILAKKAEFRAELKQKAADQHKHLSAQQHKTKKGGTQSIHPTPDSTWNHPRQLQTSSGVWSSPWKAARTLHKPTRRTGSLWTFPSRHRPLRL